MKKFGLNLDLNQDLPVYCRSSLNPGHHSSVAPARILTFPGGHQRLFWKGEHLTFLRRIEPRSLRTLSGCSTH